MENLYFSSIFEDGFDEANVDAWMDIRVVCVLDSGGY